MNEQPQSTGLKQPDVMGITLAPQAPAENATSSGAPAVNYLDLLDDGEAGYIKGLGIEEITSESIKKLVQAGLSQKDSVSRISREKAELEAKIATMKAPVSETAPIENRPSTGTQSGPVAEPVATQPESRGATRNDAFEISMMIHDYFPELKAEASKPEFFQELEMRGYISVDGVDKAGVYSHLSARNELAKELRELREFKAAQLQAQEAESQYNVEAQPSNGPRDLSWANDIIMRNITSPGSVDARDLDEATRIRQASLF